MQNEHVPAPVPSPAEVLRSLADQVEAQGLEQVDRIQINSATSYEYAVRIYPDTSDEYEGFLVRFESLSATNAASIPEGPASWGGE